MRLTIVILIMCTLLVLAIHTRRDTFQQPCMPPDVQNYKYTRRVLSGNQWVCPQGWQDTGCGEYQCRKLSRCSTGLAKDYDFTRRVLVGNTWKCPQGGWQDTGCSWEHGERGEYQCRRKKAATQVPKASVSGSIPTNITYYGQSKSDDNGKGFIGIDLFAFDRFEVKYGNKRVYPVAVHHDHAPEWLYSVVEVSGSKITPGFLGYVVDICNRNDSSCKNKDKNGLSFLIDIHKTGFVASGNNNNGNDFTTGYVKKVGRIPITSLPAGMFPKGDNTYIMCSCQYPCTNNAWKHLGKLKAGKETC